MESDDENLVINPENLNLSDEGSDDDGDRIFGKLSFLDLKTKIDKG